MYKLAFIGGSINSIAGKVHQVAAQMDKKFELTAGVFSRNEKINLATQKKWQIKKIYKNCEELIFHEKNNIDLVVVLTPSPLHFENLVYLLEKNIPIICEKPMLCNQKDIFVLEKIYKKTKNFLVITNNYSGYPMIRELKERIKNQELGDILKIKIQMPQESFLRPPKNLEYPQYWRKKDDFIPCISLDLGVHLHHLCYFLLEKEPEFIFANFNKFSKYDLVDDVFALLKYKNNTQGELSFSKTMLGNRNSLKIEVFGKKASATWEQNTPEILKIAQKDGQILHLDRGSNLIIETQNYNRMIPGHPSGFIEGFANIYCDIYSAFNNFKNNKSYLSDYIFGFEHAKNSILFLHSLSLANKKKSWQKIVNF